MTAQAAAGTMRLLDELKTHDSWSREQLLAHQRHALQALIRHAAERSPYYRELLPVSARSGELRLEELPTLTKATLMREWDRIVTDPELRFADAWRHVEDEGAAADLHLGRYRILATGGSTRERGIFVYGGAEFEACMAGCLRALATVGISAGTRLASIGSPSAAHLSNQMFAFLRAGRIDAPRLTVTTALRGLVSALNSYEPDAVMSYPTILRELAEEQAAGRLGISPRIVISSSEVLSEETRRRVEGVWGVPVHNGYATTEAAVIASECRERCGLHVWEDTLILEVVDEQNRQVQPGAPGHKVLLTNLWNRVQPLIRYELADAVTLADGPNPTGRPFARIAEIQGRTADILRLPATSGGTVSLHPMHLHMAFMGIAEVRQYQLHPGADQLRVTLVIEPQASRDVIETRVQAALLEALRKAGAAEPRISIETVERIARVGSGAKLTLIRSSP
jgi:phenylacetate-coenzyme A ligase PaaK-like adenylate-forming protein